MIALAGMEMGRDIEVVITGLRPGEKMHEELLSLQEHLLPTHHEKIMRAETPGTLTTAGMAAIASLASDQGNHRATRELLIRLIPEYKV
jgi:FlaA1/EpsC-like NDP-sugar epimerase